MDSSPSVTSSLPLTALVKQPKRGRMAKEPREDKAPNPGSSSHGATSIPAWGNPPSNHKACARYMVPKDIIPSTVRAKGIPDKLFVVKLALDMGCSIDETNDEWIFLPKSNVDCTTAQQQAQQKILEHAQRKEAFVEPVPRALVEFVATVLEDARREFPKCEFTFSLDPPSEYIVVWLGTSTLRERAAHQIIDKARQSQQEYTEFLVEVFRASSGKFQQAVREMTEHLDKEISRRDDAELMNEVFRLLLERQGDETYKTKEQLSMEASQREDAELMKDLLQSYLEQQRCETRETKEQLQAESAKRERAEDMLKRIKQARVIRLPSWTEVMIAKAGSEATKSKRIEDFIHGYPLSGDERVQRFIGHLDSGNQLVTLIRETAFKYLGLAKASTRKGSTTVRGVTGVPSTIETYQITLSIPVLNCMKPDTIFARTMTVGVLPEDGSRRPGMPGYWDLLLCAEDVAKFCSLGKNDYSVQFDVLVDPPRALYHEGLYIRTAGPPPKHCVGRHQNHQHQTKGSAQGHCSNNQTSDEARGWKTKYDKLEAVKVAQDKKIAGLQSQLEKTNAELAREKDIVQSVRRELAEKHRNMSGTLAFHLLKHTEGMLVEQRKTFCKKLASVIHPDRCGSDAFVAEVFKELQNSTLWELNKKTPSPGDA